jgi:transcriptional regulator with XRE-family HTH domain
MGVDGFHWIAITTREVQMPMGALNPIDKHVGGRVRMRRLMLDMSQADLANGLGLTFQQVQKYEKGTNRIGASRLQHISQILQVPVLFFFEGALRDRWTSLCLYVTDFLATSDGLSLAKAFMLVENPKLRRAIVRLVEEIAPERAWTDLPLGIAI